MQILENFNLKDLNTFGINVRAKFLVELNFEKEITELFSFSEFRKNKKLFIGGGSNILFTKDFDGLIILNKLKGLEILEENSESVFVKAMAGELWADLVDFAVQQGYAGIENLTSIPGTVGAAPVQNIGAYGVELKDSLERVEAYEIATGQKKVFSKEECQFGYRESVFKNKLKDKYFISAVILKLNKNWDKKIGYKTLQEYIQKNNLEVKNVQDVSQIIAEIRKSKLPNPKILGNAGSFFKNPYITKEELFLLQQKYPEIPFFEEMDKIKIPAGWLIEKTGWKGKRDGSVGIHEKQALVLVNYGGATGQEIKELSEKIINSVRSEFGLILEREVNLI